MKRKFFIIAAIFALIGGIVIAQDLKIEYQLDVSGKSPVNYFTFTGPIRYMAVDKDHIDVASGASSQGSTHIFQPYRYDVKGNSVFPDGLRGLFLYGVNPLQARYDDNLTVNKERDGSIVINFSHRGTAYQIATDRYGRLSFPNGNFRKRAIGYIQGHDPQVISRDFSRNGTAAGIDWDKVWSDRVAGGRTVTSGVDKKTGNITSDAGSSDAMYYWDGTLQVTLVNNILRVTGGLNAVKR